MSETDIRPHDELEGREVLGREFRKGALAGGEMDPIARGVQLEIGKHGGVRIQPGDLRLERFRAGHTDEPPATAKLQHAGLRRNTPLVEIVQQHKTRGPDLVPMERGESRVVL